MSEYPPCFVCPQVAAEIEMHLQGTGHATLAEMRAEFDAMRAEVAAWRGHHKNPGTYWWFQVLDAVAATDAARPKEPT